MQSTLALRDQAAKLLAADSTTLAPAMTGNKLHLASANFTPSEGLAIGDLTEATFTGYAALVAGTGAQGEGFDPGTLDSVIDILAPVGGWRFVVTSATGLPQTIYGFYLTNNAGSTLYGAALFDAPIVLNNNGDVIVIDRVYFRLLNGSLQ